MCACALRVDLCMHLCRLKQQKCFCLTRAYTRAEHAGVCARIRAYIHAYLHACMHTYIHTCIHACMHTYIHTCMHTCMHTRTHIRTHIHTRKYVRTYHIHTCMHDTDGYEDVDPSKTTVVRGEPGEDFARKSEIGAFAGRAVDEVCLCLFMLARLPFSIFDYLWVCLSLCLSSPLSLYCLTTTAIMPARA